LLPSAQNIPDYDFVSRTMKVSLVNPAELKILSQDTRPLFFPFGGHFLHVLKFLYEQLNGDARRRRQTQSCR
jgi:hypothetical protein